jgi:hypothetical protein
MSVKANSSPAEGLAKNVAGNTCSIQRAAEKLNIAGMYLPTPRSTLPGDRAISAGAVENIPGE